jgi:phenylpropionate dioxygenase-like ring-hydroxylating dioxygenase large terminal subunit
LVVWYTTSTTTATTTTTTQQEEEKEGRSDEKQIWSAQIDACTHRLAPLSQGRVNPNTKCIECPYHGWQFDSQGTVTCIPQLETNRSIESVRKQGGNVKTFPVHAVGDLLFVFLPSSVHGETFEQSLLPEDYYYPYLSSFMETTQEQRQGTRKQTKQSTRPVFVRELPYSFDFLVENFMDPAHIPFAHHKLQSTRADGVPIEMSEISSNFTHVAVGFKDVTRKRPRDAYASFQRPSFYHYGEYDITRQEEEEEEGNQQQQQQQGESTTPSSMSTTTTTTVATKTRQPKLCIWITPIEAGKCRVFFQSPPIRVPTFLLHAGSNRFLNSDTWLHDAEREVVKRKQELSATANNDDKKRMKLAQMDYIYASQSDVGVSVFRKWWIEHGMADAPPNTFAMATMEQLGPKSLSRREQIDPWENHTKHCSTCRKTLGTIKRSQKVLLFLSIASGILTGGRTSLQRPPIIGLVSAGIFLYGHMFLKKLATVMEGNPEVSNVPDRSSAANAAD